MKQPSLLLSYLCRVEGIVLKSTGSWFKVEEESGRVIDCRVRGSLRLQDIESTNPIAVGDHVSILVQEDGTGTIQEIKERKNFIIRKSVKLSKQTQILAANIEMAWLVVTPALPKTSTGFIDRFIAAAESFRIPTALIFNKSDLFQDELKAVLQAYLNIYEPLGYPCFLVSAQTGAGLEALKESFKDKVNLIAGHSGVGKSSLINALEPTLKLKTGDISRQHLKGKHTTTFAEMHRLSQGGYIIDTPGIREFVNIDFKPSETGHYFIEIRALMNQCRYHNCLHDSEKDCAIKKAVEDGVISKERYYNYISILRNEDIFR